MIGRIDPSYKPAAETEFVTNEPRAEEFPVKELFKGNRTLGTLLLWTVSFMSLLAIFFLQNWLPTIAADAGLKIQTAVLATTFIQVGSITCSLFIGWPMGGLVRHLCLPSCTSSAGLPSLQLDIPCLSRRSLSPSVSLLAVALRRGKTASMPSLRHFIQPPCALPAPAGHRGSGALARSSARSSGA
jgi:hypothetical protein